MNWNSTHDWNIVYFIPVDISLLLSLGDYIFSFFEFLRVAGFNEALEGYVHGEIVRRCQDDLSTNGALLFVLK